jgi:molybdopterin converting factor subunit 1
MTLSDQPSSSPTTAATALRVKTLYFHTLRDLTGIEAETLELPAGSTIADLILAAGTRHPRLSASLGSGGWLMIARNHEFARRDEALADGDEVALMPPVSGG